MANLGTLAMKNPNNSPFLYNSHCFVPLLVSQATMTVCCIATGCSFADPNWASAHVVINNSVCEHWSSTHIITV